MNRAVMFSSASDEWTTPFDLFCDLNDEFHFTLDAAACRENACCEYYLGPDHHDPGYRDALRCGWWRGCSGEATYCNPPYSRVLLAQFIAKASEEAQKGAGGLLTVVLLLPARTDTQAFHRYLYDATHWRSRPGVTLRFLPGRLKFSRAANSAPFPSLVAILR